MLRLLKYTAIAVFAVATVAISPQSLFAAESMTDARAQDTVAIQQLIVKYAHVYDSLDVEGYVSVFAEDAQFTFTGNTLNGREEIRKFITGAKQRKASTPAAAPAIKSYHSISNTLIEFDSASVAHQSSYWQVLSGPAAGPFTVTGMGIYEDVLTKRNGQWLIQKRNISQ
ncbi:MAG: nuclear transport factor 2 family protein [Gammaproteobacteria bacterium]